MRLSVPVCSDQVHSQSVAYAPDPNIPQIVASGGADVSNPPVVTNESSTWSMLRLENRMRLTCKSPLFLQVCSL